MCCLIVTFLILSFLDILEDLLRASISLASTRLLLFSVSLIFNLTNISDFWWHDWEGGICTSSMGEQQASISVAGGLVTLCCGYLATLSLFQAI